MSTRAAVMVSESARQKRVARTPAHTFQIRTRPWQVQPFCIAPVLPGETLQNALLQARVVSDPVVNPLIGWWQQYHVFYVKHRDLADRAQFVDMVLNPAADLSGLNSAADVKTYHYGNAINWTQKCLQRVVETFFRNEGEAWNIYLIDGVPAAQIQGQSWMDSVVVDAAMPGTDLDPSNTDNLTDRDLDTKMRAWEWFRANTLTSMDYEDFLRTYGVKADKQEEHKPELVRTWSEWTYPSNTINPTDGAPSSALSWSIAGRADKDRFFREPGFLFGVAVTKPKVYLGQQKGSAVGVMNNAFSWLPAVMAQDPYTSLLKIPDVTGPLGDIADANGYWVDIRDLFLYGDQFLNFAMSDTTAGIVGLPTVGMQKRYPTKAMADALFKTVTDATTLIRHDGIINFNILGTQVDYTPRHMGAG